MKRYLPLVLLGSAAAAAFAVQSEPDKPLDLVHVVGIPVISEYALSPDGSRALLSGFSLGKEHIWAIGLRGKRPADLIREAALALKEPSWSWDGTRIAFVGRQDDNWHIYTASRTGEQFQKRTDHPGEDRRPRFSPDGKQIAYLSRRVATETGWDLWIVPVEEGEAPRRLTSHENDEESHRFSPDGRWIALSFDAGRHLNRRIGLVSPAGGELHELLPDGWTGDSHQPRWSPDGKRLAFVSDESGHKAIYTVSVSEDGKPGAPELLVESRFEVSDPAFSPDGGSLAYVEDRDGDSKLMVRELPTGRSRSMFLGSGVAEQPQWLPGGEGVAAIYEGATYPRDLWVFRLPTGRERISETLFSELDVRQMVRSELVRYPSFDDTEITGYLYLPSDASADNPVPVLIRPHGGPSSQWRNGWHPMTQFLAQRGFAVFAPNVRGSTGFGVAFEELNNGDWGRGDLQDLVAGASFIQNRPEIRSDRMGIWGVSYGGFLTLAAIGRYPEMFACAIEAVGMPDLEALYRETNLEGKSYLDRELGPLSGNLTLYRELSPLARADRVKTPLLSFHGEVYPLVPYSTKRPFIDALRSRPDYPLVELVFEGELARATYRPERYPAAAHAYLQKILEFLEIYL